MGEGVKPTFQQIKSVSDLMPWKPGVSGVEFRDLSHSVDIFLTVSIKEPPVLISDAGDLKNA